MGFLSAVSYIIKWAKKIQTSNKIQRLDIIFSDIFFINYLDAPKCEETHKASPLKISEPKSPVKAMSVSKLEQRAEKLKGLY